LGPPPIVPARKRPWSDLDSRLATQPERPALNLAEILSADRDDIR
jgi:hypothetical protein